MYSKKIKEEELKAKVKEDFFSPNPQSELIKLNKEQKALLKSLDSTQILGDIDFCVSSSSKTLFQPINFLWAEAKAGIVSDIIKLFIQLIFTIKKQNILANKPLFLGAFDSEKIAFIYYAEVAKIIEIQADFNWKVRPSDYNTKEFKQLYAKTKELLESKKLQFRFKEDCKALQNFIKENFTLTNTKLQKVQVDRTNFIHIYYRWLNEVAPSIDIKWHVWQDDFLNADFFLADLLSENNNTKSIKENLRVLLSNNLYIAKTIGKNQTDSNYEFSFKDSQKAHIAFWNLYERPPKKEYWDFFTGRRDLLVPSNIRERKGEFFTPDKWVRKAHDYLEKALGKEFYTDYYIWDCAAGTGNLLKGLSIESGKIYASTINEPNVADMKPNTFAVPDNIFQFDFLNDEFFDFICKEHEKDGLNFALEDCKYCQKSKLPQSLQIILKDEAKRKKLIIFINPPYAEAGTTAQTTGTGKNKDSVSTKNATYERYKDSMGKASNELFAQFFFRIYKEIPQCTLAAFSTLKYVNSTNFIKFRETFKAKFLKGFICPAYTFDNVKGNFPIGFIVWDLAQAQTIEKITIDIFNEKVASLGKKKFYTMQQTTTNIGKWIAGYRIKNPPLHLAMLNSGRVDFQNQKLVYIKHYVGDESHALTLTLTLTNLIPCAVFFAVRHCIPHTWINDRDQFLSPNKKWEKDTEFQNDCLAFMLFHAQNRITCKEGINHFIPFSEKDINARGSFNSHFMLDFLRGKIKHDEGKNEDKNSLPYNKDDLKPTEPLPNFIPTKPLVFSHEAKEVMEAGKELFKHYHEQAKNDTSYNSNATLYDIKAHFQGFNDKGKMNPPQRADDESYKEKLSELNYTLKELAKKIEEKVYEYEFLLP